MKRTDQIQGERLPTLTVYEQHKASHDPPGSFRELTDDAGLYPIPASNLTGKVWAVVTPNGLIGLLAAHTVREEDDGSITVKPGDGSSNSILVSDGTESWHGYITRGLWWSLEPHSAGTSE